MSKRWQATTRGGHFVRGIYRTDNFGPRFAYRGWVCFANTNGPSEDPADWHSYVWNEKGQHCIFGISSDLDLMEVQDGE